MRQHLGRDLEREAGLAHAAHPGEGHQPRGRKRGRDVGDLALATDETRALRRKVGGVRVQRPDRREVGGKAGVDHLEHPLGAVEVAQTVLPEVDQIDPGGEVVAHQLFGRVREEDLPTVAGRRDPRRFVHGRAVVVPRPYFRLARVQAHPHP